MGPEPPRSDMPRKLSEAASENIELFLPDDAPGKEYRIEDLAIYDADELLKMENPDNVTELYGDWVKVTETDNSITGWLKLPSDLLNKLDEAEVQEQEPFRIEKLTKRGSDQSSPYQAKLSFPERDETRQNRVGTATDD